MTSSSARHRIVGLALCTAVLLATLPSLPATAQAGGLAVTRHAGATRTATAVEVSRHPHPDGADAVVLARADAYGDALAAAPLAAVLDAPVLLTAPTTLEQGVAEEIARLDAETVTVLGGIAEGVADDLAADGLDVVRIAGADEWATYAAIARAVAEQTGADRALRVEGAHADPARGWPDALAASAWAAREQIPVLMTTAGALPDPTRDLIDELDLAAVTVVGGPAAVTDAVVADVDPRVGTVDRVAGDGRYDTAVAVASRGLDAAGPAPEVWVASGRGWPDALVAGPAAARAGGVLVLSDPASLEHAPATRAFLDAHRPTTPTAHLVGGTAVLSEDVAHTVTTGEIRQATPQPDHGEIPGADQRPTAVPADNDAPPISAAVPWSDPATWGGRVPQAGEVVAIPADTAVLLDVDPPALRGIDVRGTLVAADIDMTVEVQWILVTGHLALGTRERPLTRRVTVVLDPQPGAGIEHAGEGPIAVRGGTLDIHGVTPARTWTRLAATAPAGTTQLQLAEAPGWRVGDRIVVASTSTDVDQAEERTVTGVDGARVTLDQPLTHTHWGQTDVLAGTEVAQHAEVGNLTRNVVVTSTPEARAAQRGGHVMVFRGSRAQISGAEFTGLGQAGELARYPVHFHMMGNASGSYVRGASVHHTFNRCVTFHGSDYVHMQDTVGYESLGHCYFFEDGVETGNTLYCNLGLSTRRPDEGMALLESDQTPATFWITNPTNHLARNAAAGSEGHGFWYDLPEAPTGLSAGRELDIRRLPFGTFDDNVAHTLSGEGWKEGVGIFVEQYRPPGPAVMHRNHVWKSRGFGAWIEGTELRGSVLAENSIGFLGTPGRLVDATVVGDTTNAAGDAPWRKTGVGFYHERSDIVRPTFVNYAARQHSWQRPRLAMEYIADEHNVVSEVTGATFVNAARLQVVDQPGEDGTPDLRAAAIRDVDGSISGAPALLASNHPLMHDASCAWREDLRARTCPTGYDRVWLRLADQGGDPGAVTLRRDDGVSAPLDGPRWADEASGDVLLDRTYAVSSAAAHSGRLEVILYGQVEGYVDLQIPWPFPTAHVYDGWGRWHEVPAGPLAEGGWSLSGSTLTVRHRLDDLAEQGTWQRLELCAQAFCGNAGPG